MTLLVTMLSLAPTPALAVDEDGSTGDPLQVTIDRLRPGVIPARGPLVVRGTITNTSESTWTTLQVYLLTSFAPITSAEELAEAAALDPLASVGDRLAEIGQFVDLPDELGPGDSTSYRLRIPRSELEISGDPGVYWLGVQVLGTEDGLRVDGADGRARTFAPLMRQRRPPSTSLSLSLPLRAPISYDAEGRVVDAAGWRRALRPTGRLGRLLEFSREAGSFPLTWVLDPALTDLAGALAAGDPGYFLGPTIEPEVPAEETDATGDGADPETTTTEPDADPVAGTDTATEFLAGLTSGGGDRDLLALPYGDVDVAATLASGGTDLLEAAQDRSAGLLESLGLDARPVVRPLSGSLPWSALTGLDPEVGVLLADTAVDLPGPRADVTDGPALVLLDSAAASGGPVGSPASSPLELRQRLLAEAALHALSPERALPLVVSLPDPWNPGKGWRRAEFFEGLDVPWLTGVPLSDVLDRFTDQRLEPGSELLREEPADAGGTTGLGAVHLSDARDLIAAGQDLDALLPENDTLADQVQAYALLGLSTQQRREPVTVSMRTRAITRALTDLMAKVTVSGPTFVTLTGEDGPFQVTVSNGLDQTVEVAVDARVDRGDPLQIAASDPITVPGGERRSIRMQATADRIGVWSVDLRSVSVDGRPLGSTAELRIRSSQIGQYVWGAIGVGGVLLVVLLVIRIRRRLRARRSTHGPVLKQADE